MDREEIIENIKGARRAHQKWLLEAHALVSSNEVDEGEVPIKHTDCRFGKWLHAEGLNLMKLDSKEALEEINTKHQLLHIEYKKIYDIYFNGKSHSFFKKMLHLNTSISDDERQLAIQHYKKLDIISKDLMALMEALERRINSLPRTAFDVFN